MKYDDILDYIGEFGPYQRRVCILLFFPCLTCSFQVMSSVFLLAVPIHRCKIPGMDNDTYTPYDWSTVIQNVSSSLVATVDSKYIDQCFQLTANNTVSECEEYVYDTSVFESTAVTKFNWVCHNKALRSHAVMSFMFGLLMGGAIFGPLGDVLGRKMTFLMGVLLQSVAGFCLVIAPDFYSFSLLRMTVAIGNMPVYMATYNIGMEIVGQSKRVLIGQSLMVAFTVGCGILTLLAYLFRNWVILHLILTVLPMLLLSYWWLIPESPRWLWTKGKKKEAEKVIRRMADANCVKLPSDFFVNVSEETRQPISKEKFWHMFQTPVLAVRTVVILYMWMVTVMLYYGISLSAGNFHGNIYVNFILCAVVELPAFAFVYFLVNRWGRKRLIFISFLVGGSACVVTIFPTIFTAGSSIITLTMALIGKLGASIAFSMLYMYSAEIFPTVVRASAMGICFMCGRIGSIISPYVADLGDFIGGQFGETLPLLSFGLLSIVAALFTIPLPETVNRLLPETIEDSKHFGRLSVEVKLSRKTHHNSSGSKSQDPENGSFLLGEPN